ncbi:hypothetical protein AB0B66_40410 [Catellatospora sp. NPDC049111]|uniref:hypothetical protein n=1 Tax=Catellatospora sp. NPDC049111 TaxID=3155271 RepID=UPI0033CD88F0
MRYLSESFAIGALRRSVSIEQFLGPAFHHERRGIRWVAVEPCSNGRYRVVLYLSWDVGGELFGDLLEFPPLVPDADDGEVLAEVDDAAGALQLSEQVTGAVRERWANFGVAAEDYFDYVRSGRLPDPLTKDAATDIVRTLLTAEGGDERSTSWWLEGLERRTGCLHISDMIFWPAGRSWTAEEIIEHVVACTPIAL